MTLWLTWTGDTFVIFIGFHPLPVSAERGSLGNAKEDSSIEQSMSSVHSL
jgi:hypothetical protein